MQPRKNDGKKTYCDEAEVSLDDVPLDDPVAEKLRQQRFVRAWCKKKHVVAYLTRSVDE
jgi:hypothetical protein